MALHSKHSDESLVARMAGQDQEALSALYDRHHGVVFSLALRILRERAEAEEVLTDVFFQAWRAAGGFDPLRGSVVSWLITLCRSRAIDRLRARGRREAHRGSLEQEPASAPARGGAPGGPEEAADLQMRGARIRAALGALSADQRSALELAYFGGLSHSEIAAKLGEPLGTIKTRIRQGLLTLRDSLGTQFS
jgi:RNA polymerase sigma-70 factor (ECF subfamily)